jgi:hypothetical protein
MRTAQPLAKLAPRARAVALPALWRTTSPPVRRDCRSPRAATPPALPTRPDCTQAVVFNCVRRSDSFPREVPGQAACCRARGAQNAPRPYLQDASTATRAWSRPRAFSASSASSAAVACSDCLISSCAPASCASLCPSTCDLQSAPHHQCTPPLVPPTQRLGGRWDSAHRHRTHSACACSARSAASAAWCCSSVASAARAQRSRSFACAACTSY